MKIPKLIIDTKRMDKSLHDIANSILLAIKKNTREGKDMNDSQMEAYSEPYLKYKTKYMSKGKGVVRKAGVNPSTVNIMLTGKTIHSIAVTRIGKNYMIYFPDKTRGIIAYRHHTGTGQPERAFFGVSAAKERTIYQKYMQPIGRFA